MTFRLTGDIGELTEFRHRLEEIGESGKRKLLRGLAEQAVDLTAQGFDSQTDPYGSKWKETIRGGEILRDTTALRRSLKRKELTGNEFTIGFGVNYASVHQNGATIHAKNTRRVEYTRRNPRGRTARGNFKRRKKGFGAYHNVVAFVKALTFRIGKQWVSKASVEIPQRMIVPSKSRGMPAKWKTSFREAFEEYMRTLFG